MSNFSISSAVSSYSIPSRENSDSSLAKKHGATGASRKPFNDILVNSKGRINLPGLLKPQTTAKIRELLKPSTPRLKDGLLRLPLEEYKLPRSGIPFEMDELPRPNTPFNMDELERPGTSYEVGELLPRTEPAEAPQSRSDLRKKMGMIDRDMTLEQFLYACEEEPVYDVFWDSSTLIGAEDLVTMLDNFYKCRSSTPSPLEEVSSRPQTPESMNFDFPPFPKNLEEPPNTNELSLDDVDLSDEIDKSF